MKTIFRGIFVIFTFVVVASLGVGTAMAVSQSGGQNLGVIVDNGSVVVPDKPIIIRSQDITTNTLDLVVKVGDVHASEILDFILVVTNDFTGNVINVDYTQSTDAQSETILHVAGLDPGTEYHFVVSYATNGSSAYSENSDSHTAVTVIDAPVLDSIDNITDNSADLDVIIDTDFIGSVMDFVVWVKNDDNGDTYTIQITKLVTDAHVTLGIDDLDADTGYTFKVKYARENTPYFSGYSNEKSFTTDIDEIKPPVIEDIINITTDSMDLIVRFDGRGGEDLDISVHVVNKDTGDTFNVTFNKIIDGDDLTVLAIDGLDPGTEYEFKVKYSPENTSEYSAYSDPRSARTKENVVDPEVVICYNDETIIVLESELQSYLDQGAVEGTCTEDEVVICYNDETIIVLESELQSYLDQGAVEGVCTVLDGNTTTVDESVPKENIKEFIIPEGTEGTYETAAVAGAIAGAIASLAGSSIPLFAAMPGAFGNTVFLQFLELFGIIGRRKEDRNWGVVFDSVTHVPIPAVKIILLDQAGQERATTYSDKDGRFGFLVDPGTYIIEVFKKKYTIVTSDKNDELYGNLYDGNAVEVNEDHIMLSNIAMKAEGMNWQEYADKKVTQYKSKWSIFKKYFFAAIYYIGFVATLLITYFYPSVFNFIVLSIYIILFLFQKFFKRKKYGSIETENGKPVPFAVVKLYDKETNAKQNFAVTDSIGRYYLLSDNGSYNLKAQGQPVSGTQFEKSGSVKVNDGIVRKDIIV